MALSSCQSSPSFTGDYLLDRSGDFLSEGTFTTYLSACHRTNAEELIRAFERGETRAFAFASANCSHCLAWEDTLAHFARTYLFDISLIYNDTSALGATYQTDIYRLQAYFGDTTTLTGATPTLFAGRGKEFVCLASYGVEESVLLSTFEKKTGRSLVSNFWNLSTYLSALQSATQTLSFLYDPNDETAVDFYVQNLYPLAKISAKPLYVLRYDEISSAEQKTCLNYYALESYAPILAGKGSSFNAQNNATAALELLRTYYR